MQNTDDTSGRDHRYAEHRSDPLVEQDGVDHIGGVDVFDAYRLSAGGYSASETDADRYPDSLADFFFEAPSRGGNELLTGGVQEKNRGGVDIQEFPHTVQEFDEQILDVQVRQGRVSHRL
ncbi:hypothetical protein GCM10009835_13290 [Planosporangium flavigriseum]|uniref:Uncharacterized protein n=1 Tax=Planosporangium flavigriseum TaxID=373681 RepID=A0A8J3LPZ9_9ACTN|nr:hypothetical protein Pfl04_51110 [Planosporangium flavigriseum]